MKKTVTLCLLTVALLLLLLSSCRGERGEQGEEKKNTPYDADYEGYELVIGWANTNNFNEVWAESTEEEPDAVSGAILSRDKNAEEALHVKISSFNTGSAEKANEMLYSAALSESGRFEIFCGALATQYTASVSGCLLDLTPYVNAGNSWWDASLNEDLRLGSAKQYVISGDMNLLADAGTACLAMNKALCFSSKVDYPYENVKTGNWTLDRFTAMVKDFSRDLNSNGKWDEYDRYGIVVNGEDAFSFLAGLDTSPVSAEKGVMTLNADESLSSGLKRLFSDLYEKDNEANAAAIRLAGGSKDDFFAKGQTLFASSTLGEIQKLKEKSGNIISAVPYPKASEEQKDYVSAVDASAATGFSLVKGCKDAFRAGNILDTMGSFHGENVTLLGVDDKQTLEMIPYITGKRSYAPAFENTDLYTGVSQAMEAGKGSFENIADSYGEGITVAYKDTASYYGSNAVNKLKETSKLVQSSFPVSFWNYNLGNQCTAEDVKLWAECGITLGMTPHFNYERDDKGAFLDLLDACSEYGIKVILCVEGLEFPYAANEASYAALCQKVYNDFAKHPAVYSVALGDEPNSKELYTLLSRAIALAKENIPGAEYHVNFLPYYNGINNDVLGGQDYLNFMKQFVKESGLDFFSYDCYCQMHYNAGDESISGYFSSMKGYADVAKAAGADWWNTVLITGHNNMRCPDENDIRWQLNTSVASGAKGILWYQFYDSLELGNYYGSPVDDFGNTTETYERLAHVLKLFHAQHGDLLSSLKFKAVYHFGKAYGGYSTLPSGVHKQIIKMESTNNLPGMISFFTDAQGEEYVVIVNNSQDTTGQFTFVLDRSQTSGMARVRENGKAILDCLCTNHSFTVTVTDTQYKVAFWLNPGQLEIFKIS